MLVVVAHPDDEVLGCGALLATLRDVRIVHVTDGAPRHGGDADRSGFQTVAGYARARRDEALAALSLAGVPLDRVMCLGVADQEAAAELAAVARRLVPLIGEADLVLTHAFEGGHSDHDAVAFAVHAAHHLCDGSAEVFEMPFYYAEETGWVRQRFLPPPQPQASPEQRRTLSPSEHALKAAMIAAHATQRETLEGFALDVERFRRAPDYDFSVRPHAGPLLYERHGWNLTWDGWTTRVQAARLALGLAPA